MNEIVYRVTHGHPVVVHPDVVWGVSGAIVNNTSTVGAISIAWSYVPSLFDVDEPTMDAIAQLASLMNKQ